MNRIKPITFICITALLFAGCGKQLKYHYAIPDFRWELQPALEKIVSKGIVGYYDSDDFLNKNAKDVELEELSLAELPMLRLTALRIMVERSRIYSYDLVMQHLDDTAVVALDRGEFGILYVKVADDLIHHTKWKSISDKNKIIDEVITKHNDLESAYKILYRVAGQERYYTDIKK